MPGLLQSREVILAKTETTYNTDSVPVAGTNAVLVRNVNWASAGLRMNDRPAVRSSIGKLQRIFGGTLKSVSMEVEIKGSGAAGTAPEIGPLLTACGMSETVVAATSVTYRPNSGNTVPHSSITLYFFEGGRKRHILTGCRGTVSFSLEAGGIMVASFTFTGHYTEPTDQTQPAPTYNATVPRAVLGMAVSLNGVTAIVAKSWSFALNNTIALPPSISSADGYGDVLITDRDVTGEITIESELDSVIDIDVLLSGGTRFAFASGTLGSVAGNRVAVSTPAASTYVTDTSIEEADGIRLRRIPLAVDDSTSDQEISVAFT
jgi:hypothetical protein